MIGWCIGKKKNKQLDNQMKLFENEMQDICNTTGNLVYKNIHCMLTGFKEIKEQIWYFCKFCLCVIALFSTFFLSNGILILWENKKIFFLSDSRKQCIIAVCVSLLTGGVCFFFIQKTLCNTSIDNILSKGPIPIQVCQLECLYLIRGDYFEGTIKLKKKDSSENESLSFDYDQKIIALQKGEYTYSVEGKTCFNNFTGEIPFIKKNVEKLAFGENTVSLGKNESESYFEMPQCPNEITEQIHCSLTVSKLSEQCAIKWGYFKGVNFDQKGEISKGEIDNKNENPIQITLKKNRKYYLKLTKSKGKNETASCTLNLKKTGETISVEEDGLYRIKAKGDQNKKCQFWIKQLGKKEGKGASKSDDNGIFESAIYFLKARENKEASEYNITIKDKHDHFKELSVEKVPEDTLKDEISLKDKNDIWIKIPAGSGKFEIHATASENVSVFIYEVDPRKIKLKCNDKKRKKQTHFKVKLKKGIYYLNIQDSAPAAERNQSFVISVDRKK